MASISNLIRGADREYFDLFERAGANVERAGELLDEMLAGFPDSQGLADAIRDCEGAGDQITHELIGRLNRTFVTPIDRQDILDLAGSLDDIVDYIEEVADYLGLYRIEAPISVATSMPRRACHRRTPPSRARTPRPIIRKSPGTGTGMPVSSTRISTRPASNPCCASAAVTESRTASHHSMALATRVHTCNPRASDGAYGARGVPVPRSPTKATGSGYVALYLKKADGVSDNGRATFTFDSSIAGTIDDIVTVPRDVQRHNQRLYDTSIVPVVHHDTRSVGLAITGRF